MLYDIVSYPDPHRSCDMYYENEHCVSPVYLGLWFLSTRCYVYLCGQAAPSLYGYGRTLEIIVFDTNYVIEFLVTYAGVGGYNVPLEKVSPRTIYPRLYCPPDNIP